MEVQQQFGDQVQFVGVPGLAAASQMQEFVDVTGVTAFPHIPDEEGVIWNRFGVIQQRTYVFINDDGTWEVGGYGSLRSDVEDLIAT